MESIIDFLKNYFPGIRIVSIGLAAMFTLIFDIFIKGNIILFEGVEEWKIIAVVFLFFTFLFLSIFEVGKKIKKIIYSVKRHKYEREKKSVQGKKSEEEFNLFFDSLSVGDKEILIKFIKQENKIMLHNEGYSIKYSKLLSSHMVYAANIEGFNIENDENIYWLSDSLCGNYWNATKQYKLKEEIFEYSKYLYEKNGKLGNF